MSFNRKVQRQKRHLRLRQRVIGTAARPRMSICVTNKHMYVQFIDDDAGRTLAQANSLKEANANLATAKALGASAADAPSSFAVARFAFAAFRLFAWATVFPASSSMNCTYMCLFVTQIDMRGRAAVPITR